MKRMVRQLVPAALVLAVACPCLSAGPADLVSRVPEDRMELYLFLDSQEKRLSEFRDSEEALAAKLLQLEYMNRTRERYGAPPLRLDIFACRVANSMAAEAAINRYAGHWNLAGEKPYHRWAFAGGLDHVTENAAAISTNGRLDTTPGGAVRMMREMYDEFIAEKPPDDGHRRAALDPRHNYVGLGYFTHRYEFRYYEEYLDRYLRFDRVDSPVRPEQECVVSFRPISRDLHVYALIVYYEPFPSPMTPAEINRMGPYRDHTDEAGISIWPWQLGDYREDGRYTVPLVFPEEGLYYIHIYLDDEEFSGSTASTEGKIQASGIVIRVSE